MYESLARPCARGWRQEHLIEELLTFEEVPVKMFPVPGRPHVKAPKIGKAMVDWTSWKNLRDRLVAAGFTFEHSFVWIKMRSLTPEALCSVLVSSSLEP